jgi:pimeloyl-ACP methyl ester carboxylesterase
MAVPHQTGRARSGELSIHYRKLGTPGDTPILIVHGLSYFSYDWLGVAHSLGAGREVVAMDMRGFGDSDWSPSHDYGSCPRSATGGARRRSSPPRSTRTTRPRCRSSPRVRSSPT